MLTTLPADNIDFRPPVGAHPGSCRGHAAKILPLEDFYAAKYAQKSLGRKIVKMCTARS
jgi:hypothetical protein